MKTCIRVHYWGRVQGVGFRATAASLAQGFAVTGYVRNLPDGQVELVAEGEADEVERFLGTVDRKLAGNIAGRRTQAQPPEGHTDFVIRG